MRPRPSSVSTFLTFCQELCGNHPPSLQVGAPVRKKPSAVFYRRAEKSCGKVGGRWDEQTEELRQEHTPKTTGSQDRTPGSTYQHVHRQKRTERKGTLPVLPAPSTSSSTTSPDFLPPPSLPQPKLVFLPYRTALPIQDTNQKHTDSGALLLISFRKLPKARRAVPCSVCP